MWPRDRRDSPWAKLSLGRWVGWGRGAGATRYPRRSSAGRRALACHIARRRGGKHAGSAGGSLRGGRGRNRHRAAAAQKDRLPLGSKVGRGSGGHGRHGVAGRQKYAPPAPRLCLCFAACVWLCAATLLTPCSFIFVTRSCRSTSPRKRSDLSRDLILTLPRALPLAKLLRRKAGCQSRRFPPCPSLWRASSSRGASSCWCPPASPSSRPSLLCCRSSTRAMSSSIWATNGTMLYHSAQLSLPQA